VLLRQIIMPLRASIRRLAQTTHAVKRSVSADQGLAVIATKAGNPVVILTEPPAGRHKLSLNKGSRIADVRRQPQGAVAGKKSSGIGLLSENNGDFAERNDGDQERPLPTPSEEGRFRRRREA